MQEDEGRIRCLHLGAGGGIVVARVIILNINNIRQYGGEDESQSGPERIALPFCVFCSMLCACGKLQK